MNPSMPEGSPARDAAYRVGHKLRAQGAVSPGYGHDVTWPDWLRGGPSRARRLRRRRSIESPRPGYIQWHLQSGLTMNGARLVHPVVAAYRLAVVESFPTGDAPEAFGAKRGKWRGRPGRGRSAPGSGTSRC